MLVVISKVYLRNGFFMNRFGLQQGEGFEYHSLVLAIVIALLIKGSGAVSRDRVLSKNVSGR